MTRLAVVVPFRDEQEHLPALLSSLALQTRPPDELVLVDDGSTDASAELAQAYAAVLPGLRLLRRPTRARERDRLGGAGEMRAFLWGVEELARPWDVLAKLDADLILTAAVMAEVLQAFERDPSLGITGPYLSLRGADGSLMRERCPPYHVRGATKFYRRDCWVQIAPVEPMLGWDTIDEVSARMHGWRTASFACAGGDPVHLRPTGAVDGRLRAQRRWGACAYAIGDDPVWLIASALRRALERPPLLGAGAYLLGWWQARRRGVARAPAAVRAHVRTEQQKRLRGLVGRVMGRAGDLG
jgi:biofilm PGA synthesis N-glycosyltransferase PgaC